MPYCRKCGNELLNGQFVCPRCGQNQNQSLDTQPEAEKVPITRLLWMWCFALGGGIILASTIIGAKNPDGAPRYAKSNRTQAIIALILSICLTALFILIYAMA